MKKSYNFQQILKKYSAKNRISKMEKVYKNIKEWQLFARKIQKNEFFRESKLREQNYECPLCNEYILDNGTLHHITYDWYCSMNKFTEVPQCKLCHDLQSIKFRKCSRKTVMVHQHCHRKLHHKKFLEEI